MAKEKTKKPSVLKRLWRIGVKVTGLVLLALKIKNIASSFAGRFGNRESAT